MNLIELDRPLKQLRLGGMAAVLETRLRQAHAEAMAPAYRTLLLAESHLTRRLFGSMVRRMAALPLPTG